MLDLLKSIVPQELTNLQDAGWIVLPQGSHQYWCYLVDYHQTAGGNHLGRIRLVLEILPDDNDRCGLALYPGKENAVPMGVFRGKWRYFEPLILKWQKVMVLVHPSTGAFAELWCELGRALKKAEWRR